MLLRRLHRESRKCSADACEAQKRGARSKRVFRIGVDTPARTPSAVGEAVAVPSRKRERWRNGSGRGISRVVGQRRLSAASAFVAGAETAGCAATFFGNAA